MPLAAELARLPALLEYDRQALLGGQIWRLWTAHLVHYTPRHALIDGAVLLLAGLIAARRLGAARVATALALGAPFISLGLLLAVPGCGAYRGASGLAVMLAVLAGATLWPGAGRWSRTVLALLPLALAAKIANEALGAVQSPIQGWTNLPPDVAICWQAHLLGAVAGCLAAWRWRAQYSHN